MHLSVLGHWQHSTEKFIIRNSSARTVDSKKLIFFRDLLEVNQCHFGRRHNSLTIFDLMVRDRADRSCCSNQQFHQNDSDQKNILALFGTLDAPGGKFFWTVRKTVDR